MRTQAPGNRSASSLSTYPCMQLQAQTRLDAEEDSYKHRGVGRTPGREPRRALVRMRPAVRTMKLSHAALQVRCCWKPGAHTGRSGFRVGLAA